jgi:hypothetical protein
VRPSEGIRRRGFTGGGIGGSYKVEGRTARITITDKLGLVAWSIVQSRVKVFFD